MANDTGWIIRRFVGFILQAAGGLLALLSGTCTVFLGPMAFGLYNRSADTFLTVAMVGGVPFAIGVGLFFAGRWLIGRDDTRPTRPPLNIPEE